MKHFECQHCNRTNTGKNWDMKTASTLGYEFANDIYSCLEDDTNGAFYFCPHCSLESNFYDMTEVAAGSTDEEDGLTPVNFNVTLLIDGDITEEKLQTIINLGLNEEYQSKRIKNYMPTQATFKGDM